MAIKSFSGEHRWLSNFWPCDVRYNDRIFPSIEHAYQCAKSDKSEWMEICADPENTPGKIKRLSKTIAIRPDWDEVKKSVMMSLLIQKFSQEIFKAQLIATGDDEIEEGNTWGDIFWGINSKTGIGQNNLGKMIMKIRAVYKTKSLF